MPREALDKRIKQLKEEILLLDSQVENAVRDAVEALKYQDLRLARTVYENDRLINEKRYFLETNCIANIAPQQPSVMIYACWLPSSRSPLSLSAWAIMPKGLPGFA